MVDTPIVLDEEPSDDELADIEAAEITSPKCTQCDRPAKSGQPTCGRPECRAAHFKERKARNNAQRRLKASARAPTARATGASSSAHTNGNGTHPNGNGNGSHPNGTAEPFEMLTALRSLGANVVAFELEVDGERWALTKTEGGR